VKIAIEEDKIMLMQNEENIPFNAPLKVKYKAQDIQLSTNDVKVKEDANANKDYERMETALKSLNAGIWSIDISINSLIICARCKEIIPFRNDVVLTVGVFYDFVAFGYGKKVVETFLKSINTGADFDMEVPVIAVNGSYPKWVRITGTPVLNNANVVQKLHGTIEDISERKNNELLRQDFLAMVSHDLRSPLSVIKLYMQLCGRSAINSGNNYVSETLKKAELQVFKMNRMIKCYLESPGIGSRELECFPVTFDIKELLKEVISDLLLLHPGYILFLRSVPGVSVYADKEKIAQVVQNLLSNAIKYSSPADVITVHFGRVGNCLQVAVEDQGMGIAANDQDKVFDRFYRVKSETAEDIKGYGIGLYLSKQIIKQHKGDIWLKSEVNKGSKFYFTLPLS
jgi:two-component system sensor histidine kinase VicK